MPKSYAAPKRRNVQHLLAKMKPGAGTHGDKRPAAGPSTDEWSYELDEDAHCYDQWLAGGRESMRNDNRQTVTIESVEYVHQFVDLSIGQQDWETGTPHPTLKEAQQVMFRARRAHPNNLQRVMKRTVFKMVTLEQP